MKNKGYNLTKRRNKKVQRGKGQYLAQVNAVRKVLKLADLYRDQNQYPKYSNFKLGEFKSIKFFESYKKVLNERFYDYELKDNSLIQFISYTDSNHSFCYISSPFSEEVELNNRFTGSYPLKENFLIVRYDYQPSDYDKFCHPCAHFHFNIGNQIRLGIKKKLNPISFIFFILRQCYPDKWSNYLERNNDKKIYRNIRNALEDIPKEIFNDEKELVLL